jgi:hypothetical protein
MAMMRAIRTATADEFACLANGYCPTCDRAVFQPGPREGVGQSFECIGCSMRFNVAASPESGLVFAQVLGARPDPDDWSAYRAKWGTTYLPSIRR